MLQLLRDHFAAAQLRARYKRIARERVVQLLESSCCTTDTAPTDGKWFPITTSGTTDRPLDSIDKQDLRCLARELATKNPHARNVLQLLDAYVIGPECRVTPRPLTDAAEPHAATADRLWRHFLTANAAHFGYREFARRTWRDGETFVRLFPQATWPPRVRFLDPETIGPSPDHPETEGIITDPADAETPLAYLHIDAAGQLVEEPIPADLVVHSKIGADSNELRGVTFFAPLIGPLQRYEAWVETELVARKLQASMMLWRKVNDGPTASFTGAADDDLEIEQADRDRFLPGSILTTNAQTSLQFLSPETDLRDAVPLGRMLLLAAAAGAGLPEYMLTGDASNANFASTLIAEGPAVKLFVAEQHRCAAELSRLWRRVLDDAARLGLIPRDQLAQIEPDWTFPTVVARDRPRERYADVRLVAAGVLSRAEVARRENVDPATMRAELAIEAGRAAPSRKPLP